MTSPPPNEEAPARERGGFRLKLTLAAVALLLIVAAPFWAPLLLRRLAFFRVRSVEIIGARYVPVTEVLKRLAVDTTASVWEPTAPLERRVFVHPQVRTVSVRRKLPGTLVVTITEHAPVALVPGGAGFQAYDARGVALPMDLTRTPVDVPVVPQRDVGIFRLLGAVRVELPTFFARVSQVRPVGADELVLDLAELPVRTMRDVTVDQLGEIAPVENDLARRQLRAAELDLRYRDQVIARLP
jgi:cell division protein FtsQ